ncbi:hypothetical protein Q5O14_15615 [Eubacteriaceae bacterium ES2]|nr:hypothetical protein Q5O14_15615 [Eubacteriaceae bacterium ES2]
MIKHGTLFSENGQKVGWGKIAEFNFKLKALREEYDLIEVAARVKPEEIAFIRTLIQKMA